MEDLSWNVTLIKLWKSAAKTDLDFSGYKKKKKGKRDSLRVCRGKKQRTKEKNNIIYVGVCLSFSYFNTLLWPIMTIWLLFLTCSYNEGIGLRSLEYDQQRGLWKQRTTQFLDTSKPSGHMIPEIETALSGKKNPSSMVHCLSRSQRHHDYVKTLDYLD